MGLETVRRLAHKAAMVPLRPLALAFVLSVILSAAVQWVLLKIDGMRGGVALLPPLIAIVAMTSGAFALLLWRRVGVNTSAIALAAVLLVFGAGVYAWGFNNLRPDAGGDIGYLLARLVSLYFLVPATAAVPVHWWLLRADATPPRMPN
jgi:hypothetical protein